VLATVDGLPLQVANLVLSIALALGERAVDGRHVEVGGDVVANDEEAVAAVRE